MQLAHILGCKNERIVSHYHIILALMMKIASKLISILESSSTRRGSKFTWQEQEEHGDISWFSIYRPLFSWTVAEIATASYFNKVELGNWTIKHEKGVVDIHCSIAQSISFGGIRDDNHIWYCLYSIFTMIFQSWTGLMEDSSQIIHYLTVFPVKYLAI